MRLLADENIPRSLVEALRRDGHDVVWIRTAAPGSSDAAILDRAAGGHRIVITFDRDFGELTAAADLPDDAGVILLRLQEASPDNLVRRVAAILNAREDWGGRFSVIEPDRIRSRAIGWKK